MFDTSTLFVVFLVLLAASLSSYMLSLWAAARMGRPLVHAAMSIGTLLLLGTAAIGVLWISILAPLQFPGRAWLSERTPGPAPADNAPGPGADVTISTTEQSQQREPSGSVRNTFVSDVGNERRARAVAEPDEIERGQAKSAGSEPAQTASPQGAASAMSYSGGFATPPDPAPWAATRCVVAFHMDPSDLPRWTIENECPWPVAILIATCSLSTDECFDRQSRSWRYRPDGMVLPAKIQRSVTADEQTQLGRHIRYVACYVTARDTIRRIARGADTGPTSFLARPDAASAMDMCLSAVLRLSDEGNSSGYSIDAMLNVPLPENRLPQP